MLKTDQTPRTEPPLLQEYGWKFYEKCRCSGAMKYKYRNENFKDLELEWWKDYYKFKITYNGTRTKIPLTKLEKLEEILKAL